MQQDSQETEVRQTVATDGNTTVQRQTATQTSHTSGMVIAQRLVWFITGVVVVIVILRFIFLLLGANRDAGFANFVYSISGPLVSPFVGIFGQPTYGTSVFEISSVLAAVIYLVIGWGIVKLLGIAQPQNS